MAQHGIELRTLKQTFQFLECLKNEQSMQAQVASNLYERIKNYYKSRNKLHDIEKSLSQFLTNVSNFYKRLCYVRVAGKYNDRTAEQIVTALLDCLPRFLAAMHYLWYDVNATFEQLGGGGWKNDYPGAISSYWYSSYGGDLDAYLHAMSGYKYGGMMPGGFTSGDVRYDEYYDGYRQGFNMAPELGVILNASQHNDFRDVLVISILSNSGTHMVNSANVLALVGTFCAIVETDSSGSKLKEAVQKKDTCIKWTELIQHCAKVKSQMHKIFRKEAFDHTGQSLESKDINIDEFAKSVADWLRKHLRTVRGNLQKIKTNDRAVTAPNKDNLGAYFTENLYPYGFILEDNHFKRMISHRNALLQNHWRDVLNTLLQPQNGLDRLRELLEGGTCPPKKPEIPPSTDIKSDTARPVAPKTKATKTEPAKPVVTKSEAAKPTATKTEATKTEATKTGVTKAEAGKPTATKTEATKPVATKTEAAKPQAKNAGGSKNQNTGQSDAKSTTSSAGTSPSQPTGSAAAPGPAGAKGDKGKQGPGSSKQTNQDQKGQTTAKSPQIPPQPAPPPPAPAPSTPASPASPSKPDGGGGSTNGGDKSQKPAGPQVPAPPQTSSDKSLVSSSPGAATPGSVKGPVGLAGSSDSAQPGGKVQGSPGGGTTVQQSAGSSSTKQSQGPPSSSASNNSGGQVSSSDSGPTGGKGQDPKGGDTTSQKPDGASQSVTTASPGVQASGSPSPIVPAPGGSQDTGVQVSTSGTTQLGDQGTSPTSTTAATTASTGSGAGSGGGGQGQTFAATDAQSVINSPRSPQIHSFPPPEIDVIYGPQKISENLEEAYRKVLQKNMKSVPPNLSIEITKPPTSDTDNSKDAPLVVLHDPTEFGLGGAVASDEDEPVVLGVGGEPIANDSDVFKQQHIAEIQDVHQKLYEKQKAEDLELKKALEAGAKRQHQDTLWTENMDDVLRKEKETEEMRKNLQDDTLGEVVKIPFNTKICAPENIIQRAVHGFNTYPPPIIDIRAVDSKNIYSIPHGSNKLVNVPDPKQLPTLDIIRAYIPRSYDINPPNISQDEYNSAASPVLFDITKPTRPTDEDDDDKSFQHMDDVKSVLIGVNPAYEVIDDGLEISKVTHTDAEETVDLFIETLNTPPSQPLHDYDPENIPMIKIQADHTRDGLGDFSMGDADRSDINIPMAVFPDQSPDDLNTQTCQNPWYVTPSSTSPTSPPASRPPESDHLPSPNTVRKMLYWMVGLNQYELVERIKKHVASLLEDFKNDALYVTLEPYTLTASLVSDKLTEACLYSASILYRIKHTDNSNAIKDFFKDKEKYAYYYSTDPACLLCQLRDYAYACHHQLEFLKSQCNRDKLSGGWQNHDYGNVVSSSASPLQAFLTDGWDSDFKTHLFDPCNLCLKSRIRMGFRDRDLPIISQQGSVISTILTPSCGGSDPLVTLSSYLNCLTRRTPRTTGEIVSFFHHFGNSLHDAYSNTLLSLGESLSSPHADCPDWDHLKNSDLQAVSGIRGHESLNSISNHNHENNHPRTLSTLVGRGSDPANCHPRMSPITYRAYALYSQSFAHTYLSWTVYLPDRLHESLQKLHYDLKRHVSIKCSFLHLCSTALPLLYTHGFTPPEVGSQSTVKCSDVISKLEEIVDGKPIADLMTAMDNILYGIREPFIFTLVALWSLALLIFANTMLYRIDVLHIRSHLIRTKASHVIDVKALLSDNKKMMSLYDANYFDDDPNELLNLR